MEMTNNVSFKLPEQLFIVSILKLTPPQSYLYEIISIC